MADKEIRLKAYYDGKKAETDAKKSMDEIGKSTKRVAEKSGQLVDEKLGRAMSQFNEKTEKGFCRAFPAFLG